MPMTFIMSNMPSPSSGNSMAQTTGAPQSTSAPAVVFTIPASSTVTTVPVQSPVATSGSIPCGVRNRAGSGFYLRTHVIYGQSQFEQLYLQFSPYGPGAVTPTLTTSKDTAFWTYYDPTSRSVAFWQGNCLWSGLSMVLDVDMNSYGPALITEAVGTARMQVIDGELTWDNDRFGWWLVCLKNNQYQLMWWDTVTNQGIDTSICAEVQLLLENANS